MYGQLTQDCLSKISSAYRTWLFCIQWWISMWPINRVRFGPPVSKFTREFGSNQVKRPPRRPQLLGTQRELVRQKSETSSAESQPDAKTHRWHPNGYWVMHPTGSLELCWIFHRCFLFLVFSCEAGGEIIMFKTGTFF